MQALIFESPTCAVLQERDTPEPGIGQALVKVAYSALCGDDLSLYAGTFPGQRYPVLPGHEWAGTVTGVGPDMPTSWLGKRVTGDPTCACSICAACIRDETELCENLLRLGYTLPGACAQYMVVPGVNLYELPDGLPLRLATQAEPFAVALHALDKIDIQPGDRVAVFGSGGIGLALVNAAMWLGCELTLVAEPVARRREVAQRYGALAVIGGAPAELAALLGARPELRPDAVLESSGHPVAVAQALEIVRPGGRVCLVGYGADEPPFLSPALIVAKGLTVQGSLGAGGKLGAALSLLASGAIDVEPLLTHEFPLRDAKAALQVASDKSDGNIRSLFFMDFSEQATE